MVDTYRTLHPDDAGHTCCAGDLTDPDQAFTKRIDYILIARGNSESLTVTAARAILDQPQTVGGRHLWASDHGGVIIDLARRN